MADPLALSDLPTVEQALNMGVASGPPPSGPSGSGNIVTSALGSGVYGALGTLGSGAEAAARAAGFNSAADAAAAFAARQRATANTYATPENEAASFFSPRGFVYKTLQGLPMMAGIAGGALAGEAAAPILGIGAGAAALGGGALAAFPGAVGENIDRAREEGQPVDQGAAIKALALGVPLAAVQAALPAMGEGMLAGRVAARNVPKIFGSELAGKAAVGAAAGAAVQVPAAAAGEAIMQQMGDPNRGLAQRSQDIVNAALAGGVQGAFFGGVLHSFAKKPAATVTTDDLLRLTSDPLGLPAPQTPQLPPPGAPGMEKQLQPPQRFPPQPPTDIGGGPPGVVTPEAQPDQVIRQLQPPHRFPPGPPDLPGVQPVSGETIQAGGPADRGISGLLPAPEAPEQVNRPVSGQPIVGRQLHVGEDIPPPPEPAQLEPPHRFPPVDGGAANERVVRPASDDEALVTPPPAGGDLTQHTNAELMSQLEQQGPNTDHGKAILGELTERLKGEKIAPGQDVREVLARQDADKAKAQIVDAQTSAIKKVTRGFLPDYLKPHLGDDLALKGAIFDEAKARDAAGQPLGSRLMAIAKHFDVLDDKGTLVDPRAAQEATDTARAQAEADQGATTNLGPNPDVPSRVMRDAIPETHQPKWDALEALRKDAPQDFLPKIDELQSKLAAPKRGEAGQIVKATSDLRKAVEGQKAVDKVTGEPPAKVAPKPVVDETQGAKKFSPPVSEAKAPVEPALAPVVSKQDQLKAKQKGGTRAVQERSPTKVDVRKQPKDGSGVGEGNTKGEGATAEIKAPAGAEGPRTEGKAQVAPEHVSAITKALKAVRGNISDLMDQKLPRTSRTEKGVVTPESEKNHAARNQAYQAEMGRLDRAQAAVGKALKSGDARELAKIGDDHFPSKAYDEFYDQLSTKGQKLLDEHAQKVDDLLEAVKEASGKNHTLTGAEAFASRAPTPHDEVLSGLIDKGVTARQLLEHIARNGSNSIRRTMAAKLLQISKADPAVRFGTLDEMAKDHPTLRNVYGDYHDALDRVRIFDKADLEHTMLHEYAHAATVRAIEGDPAIRAKANELHKLAKAQMTPEEAAHPSMANSAEMVAEAMGNPDFANLLDGMKGPKGSIWQSIKDFVRGIFGFPKGAESLLDHVENLAGEASDAVNETTTVKGMERVTGLYARSVQDATERLGRKLDQKFDLHGIDPLVFKKSLFWRKMEGIAASMGRHLPSLSQYVQNAVDLRNYRESFHGLTSLADNARRALPKRGQDMLADLQLASPKKIDPRRPVDKHTWLTDGERTKLAPEIKRLNEVWNQAKRGDGAVEKAYNLAHNTNRVLEMAAQVAQGLKVINRSAANIKLGENPMEAFNRDTSGTKDDPRKAEKFWRDELTNLGNAVRQHIAHAEAAIKAETDPTKVASLKLQLRDLKSWAGGVTRAEMSLAQEPNFAVRRYGDQHVSFELAPGFGEKQAARLRQMLEDKGHHGAVIDHNIDNQNAYMRADNISSMNSMRDVIQQAIKEGLVTKIKSSGPVSELFRTPGLVPSHVTNEINAFRDAFPDLDETGPDGDRAKAHNAAVKTQLAEMQQALLDMYSDTNISKLFAVRENVQGMSGNMGRAFLERGSNTATAVAQLFMSDRMDATRRSLREEVENAKRDPNMPVSMQNKIQAAANEAFLRDAQRQWRTEPSPFDKVRRWTHFFELGLSVPYALTLHTQSWTLGHAELAKHFGYLRSAQEMAKAQVKALQVMKATFASKNNLLKDLVTPGSDRWASILTADKLKDMSPQDREDILKLNNMGAFNTSKTQWDYDGLHHSEGLGRQLHDVSSAWTLYSEMLPRYAQAFSALKLYRERAAQGKAPVGKEWNDAHSFALHQINQSQFTWADQARAFGKQGVAGSASPLVGQFQGFRAALLEKMHREFADAFGARGPEYTTQARKFLLTHLAAQTMLAGTMGLPFVGMFAGVYDRLADWASGDHTHDLRASYRGWLSNVFGNQMGEVLAHGVPRLGGVDLSTHLGEDRLLPFTDLALSKKKIEDEVKDQAFKMTGSAAHLVTNIALGARDLANGDFLEGAAKVLPEAFRNIAEGTLVDKYGYTDKAGFGLPGETATTKDVVAKMLGFTPSNAANYEEKARIASDVRARQEFDANNIQTHLAKAFNRQDPAAYASWMQQNTQFMLAHPGVMPPAGSFGNYLREHMQSAAMAGALGTPLGVSPRDFLTRGMVSFGNGGNQ